VVLARDPGAPPAATGAQPPPTSGAASASTTAAPSTVDPQELVTAARQALHAWAAFASSGDLRVVRPFFWPDGPQYRQFQREAAQHPPPRRGPPYRYDLANPSVGGPGRQPVVRATVTVSRPGDQPASFTWELAFRYDPAARRWRVWMVVPAPAVTSTSARG
jgi:hypothetical protein